MPMPLAQDAAFRQHCNRYLEPLRLELQQNRRRSWTELFLRMALSIPLFAAVAIVPLMRKGPEDDFWWWAYGFILLLTACVLLIWIALPWWTHKGVIKREVLPRLLPFFGFSYDAEPIPDLGRYAAWAVLPQYDQSSVEDELRGHHDGVPLRAMELRLRHRSASAHGRRRLGRSREAVGALVFGGVLLELQLAQPIAGTTLIGTPNMFRSPQAAVSDNSGLTALPIGSRSLKAWTDDPAAASTVLTADRVAGIEALVATADIRGLRLSWHGDRVIALIDFGENLFELPQRRGIDIVADGELLRTQLARITAVVDALALDPVAGADTEPAAPVSPYVPQQKAQASLDEQRGCLWVVLFPIAGFCLYAWLLAGHVRPLGTLALAATIGVLAGVSLANLLFHGGRVGTLILLALCLLGLAPILPPEVRPF